MVAALLGGWQVIREGVLSSFAMCKDYEFLLLEHFLDTILPLVFFFYSVIHRGSQHELWKLAMTQLAVMFIVQQRRNYNKAMLSTISDCLHYEIALPQWKATFSRYLNVFTEKKVETFHSLLRAQCPAWSSAEQITEFANVLSGKKFQADFASHFLQEGPRKNTSNNVFHLAGLAADYVIKKFKIIHENCEESREIPKKRSKRRQFQLKAFECTLDQRSFPLGFSSTKVLQNDFICDSEKCSKLRDACSALHLRAFFPREMSLASIMHLLRTISV